MQNVFDVVQTRSGNAIAGAFVYVYNSSNVLATLYSDNGVTTTANPLTTNSDGEYQFYAANGTYSIVIAATGYDGQTINGKVLFDPADATPAVSIKNYGAKNDGVTDDSAAVTAMATAVGYVVFPTGPTLIAVDLTIDVPVYFDSAAYVTVPATKTLTITNNIESPAQWIFQGAGNYSLANDADSGENARQIHASWFGAFPTVNASDQTSAIAKALASVGTAREAVIDFDVGNYRISSGLTVPRACTIRGQGSRRTVFKAWADGFPVFTTGDEGVRFEGIQFEFLNQASVVRTSPWIVIDHPTCEIKDVGAGRCFQSFWIRSPNCLIRDVLSFYDLNPGAGSSLIAVETNSTQIYDVRALNSALYGPEVLIHVGANLGSGATAITGVNIDGVNVSAPTGIVHWDATRLDVTRSSIRNVIFNAASGTPPAYLWKSTTSSTKSVSDIITNGFIANSYATDAFVVEQNSSGNSGDLIFGAVTIAAISGVGFKFTQSSGSIQDVTIGDDVDVREATTPYSFTGTMTRFAIAPAATPACMPAYCYDFTIANDAAASINLRRSVFTGFLMVSAGSTNYGFFVARAASTPAITAISVSANMNSTTGVLTGTTGVVGKFTVSTTDGIIYLENRLGTSQRVTASLLTGVQ